MRYVGGHDHGWKRGLVIRRDQQSNTDLHFAETFYCLLLPLLPDKKGNAGKLVLRPNLVNKSSFLSFLLQSLEEVEKVLVEKR